MSVGDESGRAYSVFFQLRGALFGNPNGDPSALSNQCFPNMEIGELFHPGKRVPADDNGSTLPGFGRFEDLTNYIWFGVEDRKGAVVMWEGGTPPPFNSVLKRSRDGCAPRVVFSIQRV